MLNNNYICALDIGSSKISACLLRLKGSKPQGFVFDSLPSRGVREGAVVDSIELVNAITKLMNSLKAKSGVNVKYVYVNISGRDISTKHSRAIIPLAERGNKVITMMDIDRVNEQARILGSNLEEETIQIIPSSYSIDSKGSILNPIGLYSHKLEVDLFLICVKLSSMQSLSRAVSQSGYEIKDFFFSGLATSSVVMPKDARPGINIFCDIGSDITEILVFKDGLLKDIEILSIGSDTLTRDLQEALKIPLELAEDIKRSHGIIGDPSQIKEEKEILVRKSAFYKPIKQRAVSEIVTESAKGICLKIKDAVEKRAAFYEINNFIVVGRALLSEGFIETFENILSIPVKIGRINDSRISGLAKEESQLSGQKYLNYLTALGMVSCILKDKPHNNIDVVLKPSKNFLSACVNRFKDIYQEYF